jgi:mevalonate kinase
LAYLVARYFTKLRLMPTPAKILLFGEHTVIRGSQALAMPIEMYGGEWLFAEHTAQKGVLQRDLSKFVAYLANQTLSFPIDLEHFTRDLGKGIFFQANIPEGYGVGSSGAVCAAILARYGRVGEAEKTNIPALKAQFALMEGFFHGKSSGIDPLVSYLKTPIHIVAANEMNVVSIPKHTKNLFFLLDTRIARSAEQYIHWFQAQVGQKAFAEAVQNELIPQNNAAIQHILCGNVNNLRKSVENISLFQLKNMAYMIPENVLPIWKKGIENGTFSLKICGAGGGGFMLGVTTDFEKTQQEIGDESCKIIALS